MSTENHALAGGSRTRYYSVNDTNAHAALDAAVLDAYGFTSRAATVRERSEPLADARGSDDVPLPDGRGSDYPQRRHARGSGRPPLPDGRGSDGLPLPDGRGSDPADLLEQLLDLNLTVAACLDRGEPVTAPGVPPSYGDPAPLITDDYIRP